MADVDNGDLCNFDRREFLATCARRGAGLAALSSVALSSRPIEASAPARSPDTRFAWQVGTSTAEITPPLEVGILMSSGRGLWKPFERVRLPLYAKAVVVARGQRKVAIVALDLLGLGDEAVGGMGRFRKRIAEASDGAVGVDEFVLCSSHTHSAPASIGCTDLYQTEPCQRWLDDLARHIGGALRDAAARVEPCRLGVARSFAPELSVNRRLETTLGIRRNRAKIPPETRIGPEGPTDEWVHVAAFLDRSDRPRAILVGATCHPIHEMVIPLVSPDFPGEMCLELERRHPGSTALFLNGAAGNINPPTVSGGADDARKHGHRLAELVDGSLAGLRAIEDETLAMEWRPIELPGRTAAGEPLEGPFRTRIAGIRCGEASFCFLPGEVFVETALAIREASPSGFTMVVGYCEEWIGYVPTERAFANGGYEAGPGIWSKVGPGSEPILRGEAVELVRKINGASH